IYGTCFRVEHIAVTKNANARPQAFRKIASCEPVNDHMIGDPGHQYLYLHAAPGCPPECIEQSTIRRNTAAGRPGSAVGPINRCDVQIANRERDTRSI